MTHPPRYNGGMENDLPSYKPSAFYFRRALRTATTKERAIQIGLAVCTELEALKAWVRDQGMIPPKWRVDPDEARDKGWGR